MVLILRSGDGGLALIHDLIQNQNLGEENFRREFWIQFPWLQHDFRHFGDKQFFNQYEIVLQR